MRKHGIVCVCVCVWCVVALSLCVHFVHVYTWANCGFSQKIGSTSLMSSKLHLHWHRQFYNLSKNVRHAIWLANGGERRLHVFLFSSSKRSAYNRRSSFTVRVHTFRLTRILLISVGRYATIIELNNEFRRQKKKIIIVGCVGVMGIIILYYLSIDWHISNDNHNFRMNIGMHRVTSSTN